MVKTLAVPSSATQNEGQKATQSMNAREEKPAGDELKCTARQFSGIASTVEIDRTLPRLMLVTLRAAMRPDFATALEAALHGGARLIQLREANTQAVERAELAKITRYLCRRYGARWLWNGEESTARTLGADGVHWPQRAIPRAQQQIGDNFLRGASVHSLEAAHKAVAAGANYLVFGSVWETQSHPGAAPAGLEALREVCAASPVPVFAIGGVTSARVAECRAVGAHGVAVMRAVWDAHDIEAATRELI
jgi:thiamine-phosphate pyrophosphorylase